MVNQSSPDTSLHLPTLDNCLGWSISTIKQDFSCGLSNTCTPKCWTPSLWHLQLIMSVMNKRCPWSPLTRHPQLPHPVMYMYMYT